MKTWKRALALVLALVMALSLVALPSFAEGEETGGTAATQPVWPAEGAIQLNKEAKPVQGKDGVYEITLTVEGKNYKTNSDVVLVIDNSNSMYTKHSNGWDYWYEYDTSCRMYATKQAAKAFADQLLTDDSTRIALVVYGTNVRSTTGFYDKSTKAELISKIDAIEPEDDANDGATNQQAGIHAAQQLLTSEASTGKQKNIVILSDGAATKSHPFVATANYEGCTRRYSGTCQNYGPTGGSITNIGAFVPDYDVVIPDTGNQFTMSYNAYVNATCTKHGSTNLLGYGVYALDGTVTRTSDTNNGVATIWEANQAKKAGTTIFSVAFQADTDGQNTLKSCATDPAKGYYSIDSNNNVEQKLTDAFKAIAGNIAIAAKNGTVIDPMSDHVSLNFEGTPTVTSDETAYNDGRADVYLSQGTVTRDGETLNWRVGNINEGTPAVMKYRVKLNDDVVSGQTYPTNKQTTFTYTDYQDHEASKDFPIPEVTPGGGTIRMHFYLVNDQGQPINREGVEVDSPDKAAELTLEEYFLYEGNKALNYGTYQVAKKDISGYTYYGYTLNGRDKNYPAVENRGPVAPVEVTATNANREVWFAYTQSFYVAHVRMNADGNAETVHTDTYPVSASFDLTEKVNKKADDSAVTAGGYLYGGAFFDKDCTTAYPFTNEGETGLSFAPKAGATYYIWEVPNTYLIPKVLYGNGHYEDTGYQMDVVGLYMVSAIDRINYAEVGFYLDDVRTKAAQTTYTDIVDNREETKIVTVSGSVAFSNVSITKKDTTTDVYTASSLVPADKYGYMLCYGVSKESKWQTAGESFTYYPYWVTLDGVEVTNGTTRTVTYNGPGNSQPSVSDSYDRAAECKTPAANASAQLLLMDSYCADGTPIAADTPAVENVTVTVVDAAKTYELTVSAGTGIRDQVAYQAPAGKVFAGWFADQAYTTPADLDQVTEDTTIYAKYVSDSYLDLAYSRTGLFRLRGVTLISAVDNPANYQASGFVVGDQKVDVSYASRYRIFKTPANLFGAARDAKLMLADKSLSGTGTLEVTPYWITLDGTEVHGVTHTLHYNTRTIWE